MSTYIFGWMCQLIPLTRQAFGLDGRGKIFGTLEMFSLGGIDSDGACLTTIGEKPKYYVHPTLFNDLPRVIGCVACTDLQDRAVVLSLGADGRIIMAKTHVDGVGVHLGGEITADPVPFDAWVPLELIISLVRHVEREGYCSQGPECLTETLRQGLDYRSAVLCTGPRAEDRRVLCGECYDAIKGGFPEADVPAIRSVLVDGRAIPPRARVALWSVGFRPAVPAAFGIIT